LASPSAALARGVLIEEHMLNVDGLLPE